MFEIAKETGVTRNPAQPDTPRVVQPIIPEGSQESQVQESEGNQEQQETESQEQPNETKPYNVDEINSILQEGGDLDSKRLTPEGQLIQKQFQKAFTPKLQEAAEIRKRIEELERGQGHSQSQPSNDVFATFQRDPIGVMRDLSTLIDQKEQGDPYDEKNAGELRNLRSFERQFNLQYMAMQEHGRQLNAANEMVWNGARTQIPDFDKKVEGLTEFAISKGYSEEDVSNMTDPSIIGPSLALKNILMFNSMYESENKVAGIKKKQITPKELNRGGTGSISDTGSEGDADHPPQDMSKWQGWAKKYHPELLR